MNYFLRLRIRPPVISKILLLELGPVITYELAAEGSACPGSPPQTAVHRRPAASGWRDHTGSSLSAGSAGAPSGPPEGPSARKVSARSNEQCSIPAAY